MRFSNDLDRLHHAGDAKDDSAAAFYRRHGFIPLASRPLALFLPVATGLKLFDLQES